MDKRSGYASHNGPGSIDLVWNVVSMNMPCLVYQFKTYGPGSDRQCTVGRRCVFEVEKRCLPCIVDLKTYRDGSVETLYSLLVVETGHRTEWHDASKRYMAMGAPPSSQKHTLPGGTAAPVAKQAPAPATQQARPPTITIQTEREDYPMELQSTSVLP